MNLKRVRRAIARAHHFSNKAREAAWKARRAAEEFQSVVGESAGLSEATLPAAAMLAIVAEKAREVTFRCESVLWLEELRQLHGLLAIDFEREGRR